MRLFNVGSQLRDYRTGFGGSVFVNRGIMSGFQTKRGIDYLLKLRKYGVILGHATVYDRKRRQEPAD